MSDGGREAGKGDAPRKQQDQKAYGEGWDRIFRQRPAEKALEDSGFEVKIAILMILLNIDAITAKSRLENSSDRIREALHE